MSKTALSAMEAKVLSALDFRARHPLSDLAAQSGVSKQLLSYHLKKLQERGVIRGFYPMIDCRRLGFFYCRLAVRLRGNDPELRKALGAYVKDHPRLFWAMRLGGHLDYFFVYWTQTLAEFECVVSTFLHLFGHYIERRIENIVNNVVHLSYNFTGSQRARQIFELKETSTRDSLDELDYKILKVLSHNARLPNVQIAEEVGVSAMHVSRRITSLEQRLIIVGYRPIVDFDVLGCKYMKLFVNLRHQGEAYEQLLADFRKMPEVIYIVHGVAMPGDLDIEIVLEESDSVPAFMERLQSRHKGIIMNYEYLSYSNLLKVNYFPF